MSRAIWLLFAILAVVHLISLVDAGSLVQRDPRAKPRRLFTAWRPDSSSGSDDENDPHRSDNNNNNNNNNKVGLVNESRFQRLAFWIRRRREQGVPKGLPPGVRKRDAMIRGRKGTIAKAVALVEFALVRSFH